MQAFDENGVKAALKATLGQGVFADELIRVGREGGEIRPPMVTVMPPEYTPLELDAGGAIVPEATWALYAYVKLDRGEDEDVLAAFVAAVLATLNADPQLEGSVKGSAVVRVATPEIVEFAGPAAGRPGRKMLRRQVTVQTRHR